MAADPAISVVICTYSLDRWDDLARSVQSVRDQTRPPLEIIIVVDHNQALLDKARLEWSDLLVLANEGDRGLSGGRNTGLTTARGDIVAFLDDDAAAEPGWLAGLAMGYADESVLAVGGASLPVWDVGRPPWFPPEFDWVVGCSYRGMPTQLAAVRNLIGSNMSFRLGPLRTLAGFRTTLGRIGSRPTGCEETELCIRLSDTYPGGLVMYEPAARVRHRVPIARGTWRYFVARCFAEGQSKAIVARLVGRRRGLVSERRYASRTLPAAASRALWNGMRFRPASDLGRVLAIGAGLAITSAGYLRGAVASRHMTR